MQRDDRETIGRHWSNIGKYYNSKGNTRILLWVEDFLTTLYGHSPRFRAHISHLTQFCKIKRNIWTHYWHSNSEAWAESKDEPAPHQDFNYNRDAMSGTGDRRPLLIHKEFVAEKEIYGSSFILHRENEEMLIMWCCYNRKIEGLKCELNGCVPLGQSQEGIIGPKPFHHWRVACFSTILATPPYAAASSI